MSLLLLFDIDGTLLLRAADGHRDAMHAALREVYGIDPEGVHVDAGGRTDPEIARLILLERGLDAKRIDDGMVELRVAAVRAYAERGDDLAGHVAPGAAAALAGLAARGDAIFSLVTGNWEPIARMKLHRAGLGEYFPSGQGGFGSDSEDRTDLPGLARRRAGTPDAPWPPERTVVIGDTPRDVACARADGVACVAVATGPFAAGDLAKADAVLESLAELEPALERWR